MTPPTMPRRGGKATEPQLNHTRKLARDYMSSGDDDRAAAARAEMSGFLDGVLSATSLEGVGIVVELEEEWHKITGEYPKERTYT